jgi:hypothetical protein
MEAHAVEVQAWKRDCETANIHVHQRLEVMNNLVDECRVTAKSQAEQIADLEKDNKAIHEDFASNQVFHRGVKSELMAHKVSFDSDMTRILSDERKDGTNHETRGGGKRQCTSKTDQPTNDIRSVTRVNE